MNLASIRQISQNVCVTISALMVLIDAPCPPTHDFKRIVYSPLKPLLLSLFISREEFDCELENWESQIWMMKYIMFGGYVRFENGRISNIEYRVESESIGFWYYRFVFEIMRRYYSLRCRRRYERVDWNRLIGWK